MAGSKIELITSATEGSYLHQTPPSPQALLPRQIADADLSTPKGWIAWLAKAHVLVHNLLGVIKR